MKKLIKFAALTAGIVGACALFGGCGGESTGGNNANGGIGSASVSRENFYGVSAVSCVELLGSTFGANSVKAAAKTAVAETDGSVKDQAEEFNKYFAALDSFLDNGATSITAENNTDADYAQYETKLTVNGKDIAGNATEYVMYYNETFVSQKIDKDETESRYSLEGVMLSDGVEYRLVGGKEIEEEKGEREEELKMRAYIGEATGDYVEMKHEVSVEDNEHETEYVYRIYSNNKLVEETSVEFETETKNGKTETEYELEFRNGTGRGKYKVEREVTNGVTVISVKYNLDGKQGKFKIKEIEKDGQPYYEYTFEDNSKVTIKR